MTFYGGVDPGLSGAIFLFDPNGATVVLDMPVVARGVSFADIATWLSPMQLHTEMIYVENVHAMPRQGVSSMFKFGTSFGGVLGVLATLKVPYTMVEPSVWKRAVGLPAGAPKELSVKRAIQVFPKFADRFTRPKQRGTGIIPLDGRAEAALIAWHCYQKCQ